jgi:hypothetical protein
MTWIIAFFTNTAIGRTLAKIGAAVLLILSFGAYRHRQGVNDAKADQQAHERINHADTGIGATDGERIERLRDFAAKHGNGSPKAGGG